MLAGGVWLARPGPARPRPPSLHSGAWLLFLAGGGGGSSGSTMTSALRQVYMPMDCMVLASTM